jgi:hypothetical protein
MMQESNAKAPDERAATFQASEGAQETRSGEVLLVEAYVVLWLLLFGFLASQWRAHGRLEAKLADLESRIRKAR